MLLIHGKEETGQHDGNHSHRRKACACAVTPLMRGENRLRQCAGFEQGETEDNGIGCKGENRAVQIVRYYHVVHQYGVNADAYHYEEALKAKREQGF